jgi:hypothetical protein
MRARPGAALGNRRQCQFRDRAAHLATSQRVLRAQPVPKLPGSDSARRDHGPPHPSSIPIILVACITSCGSRRRTARSCRSPMAARSTGWPSSRRLGAPCTLRAASGAAHRPAISRGPSADHATIATRRGGDRATWSDRMRPDVRRAHLSIANLIHANTRADRVAERRSVGSVPDCHTDCRGVTWQFRLAITRAGVSFAVDTIVEATHEVPE